MRVRNVHRPALGFQDYVEELHSLAIEGKIKSFTDASSLMTLARLYEKYEDTIEPAKFGQRAVMGSSRALGDASVSAR